MLLIALMIVGSMPEKVSAASDITGNTHEKEIREIMALGIMSGYDDGRFKPENNVTRAQFAKMIAKALELPEIERPSGFMDVAESHGSKNYIMAAAKVGIITGDKGYFMPNDYISRQHMAIMMERAMAYKAIDKKSITLTFQDKNLINKDYQFGIGMTVYYGIFRGDGDFFRPLDNATRGQGASVIFRFLEVIKTGKPVGGSTPLPPSDPVIHDYSVAVVSDSGKVTTVKRYSTFAQADRAATTNQVVMYKNEIVKMTGGIGYSRGAFGSSLTNIYTDAAMRNAITYVAPDTELEYVRATENYVQVKFSGVVGYVKQENIKLVPWNAIQGRSYYHAATDGDLVHMIYSEQGNRYVSYVAGKAPRFMKTGQRYYSWDGIHFSDSTGRQVGQAAQYFQYLPARSKTNYTAKEIDAYIMKQLNEINNRNALYKDATKKSKLIGLGKTLKEVEQKHKVNAMLILSLAQHESAYGMSKRAQEQNNLFGLRVFDDNPDNIEYISVEANIQSLIDNYFNLNYIPPAAPYANGAAFGNKAQGFNVKYASDPFWGAKAAGHWYRADKMMGGKDLQNAHRIALSNTAGLNVRPAPSVNNTRLYRYERARMPILILDDVAQSPWKKVLSDDIRYDEVFIHGNYLTELTIAK